MPAPYPTATGSPDGLPEARPPRPGVLLRFRPTAYFLFLLAGAAMLAHGCATARPPRPTTAAAPAPSGQPIEVRVRVDERGEGTRIRAMPLEEYVAGCVDAEIGRLDVDAASAERMRRIQAVLCRTYAIANLGRHRSEGFDLCSTTHCQLYRRLPPESLTSRLAQQAVSATASMIVTYNGKPIQALYHAHCGGRTSAADAVWGGPPEPYLTSVEDPECARAAPWRSVIDRERLRQALSTDPRTDPGRRLDSVRVTATDGVGRATAITISGTQSRTLRGETLRAVVAQTLGAYVLRSTWFVIHREADDFVFEGRGSGHGAGLCQAGALQLAKAGRPDAEILAHYYPGTQLSSVSTLR